MKAVHHFSRLFVPPILAALAIHCISAPLAAIARAGVITNHAGSICKSYLGPFNNLIEYSASGATVKTDAGAEVDLLCPLTRNTSNSNGAYVYIDIKNLFATQTTECWAWSFSPDGGVIATDRASWTGQGFHELVLNLAGPGKSGSWTDYIAYCYIFPNSNVLVMGVDLNEL